MTVFADSGPSAQHAAHVDHGPFANHSADVDDSAHHDNGVVANFHAFSNGDARLNAGVDVFHVQQGNGAVAAVVFHLKLGDRLSLFLQNRPNIAPFAEYHLKRPFAEYPAAFWEAHRLLFLHINLHRGFFDGIVDAVDNFLRVHARFIVLSN